MSCDDGSNAIDDPIPTTQANFDVILTEWLSVTSLPQLKATLVSFCSCSVTDKIRVNNKAQTTTSPTTNVEVVEKKIVRFEAFGSGVVVAAAYEVTPKSTIGDLFAKAGLAEAQDSGYTLRLLSGAVEIDGLRASALLVDEKWLPDANVISVIKQETATACANCTSSYFLFPSSFFVFSIVDLAVRLDHHCMLLKTLLLIVCFQ